MRLKLLDETEPLGGIERSRHFHVTAIAAPRWQILAARCTKMARAGGADVQHGLTVARRCRYNLVARLIERPAR